MGDEVFVYHYSTQDLKQLSSNVRSRTNGQEGLEKNYNEQSSSSKLKANFKLALDFITLGSPLKFLFGYTMSDDRSIAFSLQPIPLDIAKLFEGKHKHWKSGTKLYEYKVRLGDGMLDLKLDTDVKEGNFPYRLVGTQDIRDKFFEIIKGDNVNYDELPKRMIELEKKGGHYGKFGFEVAKTVRKVNRGITISIKEAVKLCKEAKIEELLYSELYPFVPHLLLYAGPIRLIYVEKKQITLK